MTYRHLYIVPVPPEADLGTFSMFGQTGANKKGFSGLCGLRTSLCCVATFKSSLGAAQHDVLWPGGSICCIAKSEIYDVTCLFISRTKHKYILIGYDDVIIIELSLVSENLTRGAPHSTQGNGKYWKTWSDGVWDGSTDLQSDMEKS